MVVVVMVVMVVMKRRGHCTEHSTDILHSSSYRSSYLILKQNREVGRLFSPVKSQRLRRICKPVLFFFLVHYKLLCFLLTTFCDMDSRG